MNTRIATAFALVATLALGSQMASAGARSTVKIVNNSSYTIVSVHSSPQHREVYGSIDLLGRYSLRPGYSIEVDFDSADAENKCWQDVLAKSSNGVEWKKTMNVCKEVRWTLVD
ncbi:MAG: hypothetical protein JNJ71_19560 [Rubrivivax sp.]|nr:hypothetical protein [Rubrivivax sp.]